MTVPPTVESSFSVVHAMLNLVPNASGPMGPNPTEIEPIPVWSDAFTIISMMSPTSTTVGEIDTSSKSGPVMSNVLPSMPTPGNTTVSDKNPVTLTSDSGLTVVIIPCDASVPSHVTS